MANRRWDGSSGYAPDSRRLPPRSSPAKGPSWSAGAGREATLSVPVGNIELAQRGNHSESLARSVSLVASGTDLADQTRICEDFLQ